MINRYKVGVFRTILFIGLFVIALASGTAAPAFAQNSLHVLAQFSSVYFAATAAIAGNDIWAVGDSNPNTSNTQPFAVHFNGTSWNVVSTPTVNGGLFQGVSASASNDVWAVGQTGSNTLIEHWNGASWSVVKSPNPQGGGALLAVKAISSTDAWAVGLQNSLTGVVIEHWDGASWSLVSSPAFSGVNEILNGVAADASNDVWVVGSGATALHWNGSSWSIVPTAAIQHSSLHGVAVLSPSNVWAAGGGAGPPPSDTEATIQHWNGVSWSVVPSPNPNTRGTSLLLSIAAVSANNLWAVGTAGAEQWNGSSWSIIATPSGVFGLKGVTALGDGTVVMVSSSGAIVGN